MGVDSLCVCEMHFYGESSSPRSWLSQVHNFIQNWTELIYEVFGEKEPRNDEKREEERKERKAAKCNRKQGAQSINIYVFQSATGHKTTFNKDHL